MRPPTFLVLLAAGLLVPPATLADEKAPPEKPVSFWDHQEVVEALAFSPDGKLLATVRGDEEAQQRVFLWDTSTMTRKAVLPEDGATGALAFAPNGLWLATTGAASADPLSPDYGSARVIVWDVAGRKKRFTLDLGKSSR